MVEYVAAFHECGPGKNNTQVKKSLIYSVEILQNEKFEKASVTLCPDISIPCLLSQLEKTIVYGLGLAALT